MMDDTISRQAVIDKINERQRKLIYCFGFENDMVKIMDIAKSIVIAAPSAQRKGYTKADYIMELHKEYGCSIASAEEAHQKALEYLRNMARMKG